MPTTAKSPGKKARSILAGHWAPAFLTQSIWLCGLLLLLIVEILLRQLIGIPTAQTILAMLHPALQSVLPYALVLAGMLLMDLLLLSPLRLGRVKYFRRQMEGEDSIRELFSFYRGRRYGRAIWWRLRLWARYLLWGCLFLFPGSLALGWSALIRTGAVSDVTGMLMLCLNLIGVLSLLSGFIALCLWMLRYQPAALLLAEDEPAGNVFRRSARAMKGELGELTWLYLRLSGWVVGEWLLLPGFYAGPLVATARTQFLLRVLQRAEARESAVQAAHPRRRFFRKTPVSQ